MKIKINIKFIVSISLMIYLNNVFAQGETPYQIKRDSSFIELFDNNTNINNYFDHYKTYLGLTNNDAFSILKTKNSDDGSKHVFFQQKHNGIPLLGSRVVLHEILGQLKYITGSIIPNLNVSSSVTISETNAINTAVNEIGRMELLKLGTLFRTDQIVVDTILKPKSEIYIYKPIGLNSTYRTVSGNAPDRHKYLLTMKTLT